MYVSIIIFIIIQYKYSYEYIYSFHFMFFYRFSLTFLKKISSAQNREDGQRMNSERELISLRVDKHRMMLSLMPSIDIGISLMRILEYFYRDSMPKRLMNKKVKMRVKSRLPFLHNYLRGIRRNWMRILQIEYKFPKGLLEKLFKYLIV